MGRIGPNARDAVPALIEMLKSSDYGPAIGVLSSIGPDSREATPELIKLLETANDVQGIIGALRAIRGDLIRAHRAGQGEGHL